MGLKIFFCYAHKDKKFLEELKKHLSGLQKEGLIELWCDQDISAGQERELEVTRHLNGADIILLLVSADFIVSNYYSSEEMKHLLERHQLGETRVIPIILRPVSLQYSPLSKLHPLPALERPVSMWPRRDRAFEIITEGIVKVIEEIAPCAFHELYKNIKDSNKERIPSQFPQHLLRHLLTEQWNSPPDHLELTDREIHVWKISVQQSSEDIHLLRNLLTPEEIARAERMRFKKDQLRFIVSRGTLRVLLGFYLNVDPWQLRLRVMSHGKPILDMPQSNRIVNFNLSYSHELVLYAFAQRRQVGIDVEFLRADADVDWENMALHFLSQYEHAELRNLPGEARQRGFLNCWVRKEAYIKATGKGLSQNMSVFDVSLRPGEPATFLGSREDPQELARWSLRELVPDADYVGALVVEGSGWNLRLWH